MPIKYGKISRLSTSYVTRSPAIVLKRTDKDIDQRYHHKYKEGKEKNSTPKAFRPAEDLYTPPFESQCYIHKGLKKTGLRQLVATAAP
ncbi:MAG: hypothetical protein QW707_07920 [Candidatus Bathyarchaeia archaeon]